MQKLDSLSEWQPIPSLILELLKFFWRTGEISWDGVRITDVIDNDIKGIAWSSPEQREVEFTVDLDTGIHSGGAGPPGHSRLSDQG
jgi:hypothetical protein